MTGTPGAIDIPIVIVPVLYGTSTGFLPEVNGVDLIDRSIAPYSESVILAPPANNEI